MKSQTNVVYLDYNATHPPLVDLISQSQEYYFKNFFNPSGISMFSLSNQKEIEQSRIKIAELTQTNPKGICFTSSSTESIDLYFAQLKEFTNFDSVIVSAYEHSAVYRSIEKYGFKSKVLPGYLNGQVDPKDLELELQKAKSAVAIISASNETGVIQPLIEIQKICHNFQVPLFSDTTQSFGKHPIDVSGLSGFILSSHKLGGGLGASVLYSEWIQSGKHAPVLRGGNQENGNRSGTENLSAILSLKSALEYQFQILDEKIQRLHSLKSNFESNLKSIGCEIIAEASPRMSNTSFVILPTKDIDFIMIGLDQAGIAISTGSSCKSRARDASPQLLRMGYSEELALQAIRVSTGLFTKESELELFCNELKRLIS
jgi:cysteine desulfurase